MGMSLQNIRQHLHNTFKGTDPDAFVTVERTATKQWEIFIVTPQFKGMDIEEREVVLDKALQSIGLSLDSPQMGIYLLYEPKEYEMQREYWEDYHTATQDLPPPIPTWSDTLFMNTPEIYDTPETDNENGYKPPQFKRPGVVAFYSFKGGVGKSTALAIVAQELAMQGRRVVAVDFDLEAPGLATLFGISPDEGNGLLDYLHQRQIHPKTDTLALETCIRHVDLRGTSGQLSVIPAGQYNENYIHRLADFHMPSLYRQNPNILSTFKTTLIELLDPDIILIDARTGLNELASPVVLDLADFIFLCLAPSDQNMHGMHWIVEAIRTRQMTERPDLIYRFIVTPFPIVSDKLSDDMIVAKAETWIEPHSPINADILPQDMYVRIDYDARLPVRETIRRLPDDLRIRYKGIIDHIDATFERSKPQPTNNTLNREEALQQLAFTAPVANDIQRDALQYIFQRTSDFDTFVREYTTLIRGAKGTGKTMLFRLCVAFPETVRQWAKERTNVDLSTTTFISVHGNNDDPLELGPKDFNALAKNLGEHDWSLIWQAYAIIKCWYALRQEVSETFPLHPDWQSLIGDLGSLKRECLVENIVALVREPMAAPRLHDQMQTINTWLQERGRKIWLLHDNLDLIGGKDTALREHALAGLFSIWLEKQSLRSIQWKYFIREDVWRTIIFTNHSHYAGHDMQLFWTEEDLWRLVLRQAMYTSEAFRRVVEHQGVVQSNLDQLDVAFLRSGLHALWGERMGGGRSAYTYRWVLGRITDTQKNSFPRSLVQLLKYALEEEKKQPGMPVSAASLIRPKTLTRALPEVSKQRVQALGEEYPDVPAWLSVLEGARSPISTEELQKRWNVQDEAELQNRITTLKHAGVFEVRKRELQEQTSQRYNVAELYRVGIGMLLTSRYGAKQ